MLHQNHSRVHNFCYKVDFEVYDFFRPGKPDRDSIPPWRSDPYPKPYSAAIAAEEIKRKKYSELAKENHYIPIAQETLVIVRSDEFNDRGKVGIKARSPQTSP